MDTVLWVILAVGGAIAAGKGIMLWRERRAPKGPLVYEGRIGASTEAVNRLEWLLERACDGAAGQGAFEAALLVEHVYTPTREVESLDDPLLIKPAEMAALCLVNVEDKGAFRLDGKGVVAVFTSPERAAAYLKTSQPTGGWSMRMLIITGRELLEFCAAKELGLMINVMTGAGAAYRPESIQEMLERTKSRRRWWTRKS